MTARAVASPPASCSLARDRGVALARQMLVYPMLDDRTTMPDPELAPYAAWSYDDNYTGWHALLGDSIGGPDVPYSAAPARADRPVGTPDRPTSTPASLDIFRDECVEYARRIAATGTSVELHVHPGCPARLRPHADPGRPTRADRRSHPGAAPPLGAAAPGRPRSGRRRRRSCRRGSAGRARTAARRRPGSGVDACTPSSAISTTSSGRTCTT